MPTSQTQIHPDSGADYTPVIRINGKFHAALFAVERLSRTERKQFELNYRRGHRGGAGRGYRQRVSSFS